jgi:signal transduction histidine kinase
MHPGILTHGGLGAAVESLASKLPVDVSVGQTLEPRLPAPVEASVYFFVSEALTNVVKHARADRAWVNIGVDGDRLTVEIGDDGVGGARATPPAAAASRGSATASKPWTAN